MKFFVQVLILLLAYHVAPAQLQWVDQIEIMGGSSLTLLRGREEVKEGRKNYFRFSSAVNVIHDLENGFSLTGGLSYNQKGGKQRIKGLYYDPIDNTQKVGEAEFINNYDYLGIPLSVKFTTQGKISLLCEAGAFVSFLLKESSEVHYLYSGVSQTSSNKENYESYDYGVSAALGVKFLIKNRLSLFVKANTEVGLKDISLLDSQMFTHDIIKTSAFGLLTGLNLKIK